ncbi:hypothetical protein JTB14_028129 [Gonioctena quinquepunctata]|nr:hypothetical protein JTB14_028129 [Gonioctena quinquepunctata]
MLLRSQQDCYEFTMPQQLFLSEGTEKPRRQVYIVTVLAIQPVVETKKMKRMKWEGKHTRKYLVTKRLQRILQMSINSLEAETGDANLGVIGFYAYVGNILCKMPLNCLPWIHSMRYALFSVLIESLLLSSDTKEFHLARLEIQSLNNNSTGNSLLDFKFFHYVYCEIGYGGLRNPYG